jgi:hypothetical protein
MCHIIIRGANVLYYDKSWSESQGYMGTKVQGNRILVEEPVPTLLSLYMLPANVARVLYTSYVLIHSWCASKSLRGTI